LTGGIASGKTTVSRTFESLGVPVIDADVVAREVVEPGEAGLEAIVKQFGREVVDENGRLNRRKLRTLVFKDPAGRRALESILHPLIRQRMKAQLEALNDDYAVMAIPLLLETGQTDLVDRVLVVDAPETAQIERTRARDGVSEEEVRRILSSQIAQADRLAQADDVIENDGTIDQLRQRVRQLDEFYRSLAHGVAAEGQ
ncbi:MAG: dephospho-CoA kinase, partial [Rhodothermales bacterium]|nr:dephospho-CoA kinase [Rhodothermales bacterium]